MRISSQELYLEYFFGLFLNFPKNKWEIDHDKNEAKSGVHRTCSSTEVSHAGNEVGLFEICLQRLVG